MKKLFSVIICLISVLVCHAKTTTVDDDGPANFSTIQDAIDHSLNGDIIIVEPGTYTGNIHFNSGAFTITSRDPNDPEIVATTIIATNNSTGYGVNFDFGEGNDSIITGFTIIGQGIYCYGTSPTISKNVIKNCQHRGIYGENNAAPVITGNTITSSGMQGIYNCGGPITNNTISRNSGGISYCDGLITDNVVIENSDSGYGRGAGLSFCNGTVKGNTISYNIALYKGGACYSCNGDILENIMVGNSCLISGGAISDCYGKISNNIIAGNRCQSGGGLFGCINIVNNTIVGNIATESGGAISQCPGYIRNNIIAFNIADTIGGIDGSCVSYYNAFWSNQNGNFGGGATIGAGDIVANPLFANEGYWDTNGTADESDDVWIEGDYHLKSEAGRWNPYQLSWVKDDTTSQCIDAGNPESDWTMELWPHGKRINVGVYGGTTQASMSLSDAGNIADLNADPNNENSWVDYYDLALFTDKWLSEEVLLHEDFDRNGIVDFADFAIIVNNWLPEPPPPQPPIPSPMTWTVVPNATSTTTITMTATTATSTDGSGVEYYFDCLTTGGHDSGWRTQTNYTDTGLTPNTKYDYRVKARNKANLMETELSEVRSATTLPEDTTAPTPNPATWETEPYVSSSSSIRMAATIATDVSGVEYYFECTSNSAHSSNWQDSNVYEATNLPKGDYSFVVRTRDKSPRRNTTANSTEITLDLQPPTPDPMKWADDGEPAETYGGGGSFDYWAEMTAAEATDASGTVEYYFQCTTEPGFSSGWQSSTEYKVKVGRSNQRHQFRVKARDDYGNQTAYSTTLPAL